MQTSATYSAASAHACVAYVLGCLIDNYSSIFSKY